MCILCVLVLLFSVFYGMNSPAPMAAQAEPSGGTPPEAVRVSQWRPGALSQGAYIVPPIPEAVRLFSGRTSGLRPVCEEIILLSIAGSALSKFSLSATRVCARSVGDRNRVPVMALSLGGHAPPRGGG